MSETENQTVKINDRRRFTPEGEPVEVAEGEAIGTERAEGQVPAEQPSAEAPEVRQLRTELDVALGELDAARKRVDELARAFQALSKDRDEFKARLTRERERLIDVERGDVAQTMLEAIDELDLALSAAGTDGSPLAKGVRLIRESLLKKLDATGIERVALVGQPYDPNLAEAVDMEMTADPEQDGRVTGEQRAAYRLKDRVVRPGRVKVAKYVKPAEA